MNILCLKKRKSKVFKILKFNLHRKNFYDLFKKYVEKQIN